MSGEKARRIAFSLWSLRFQFWAMTRSRIIVKAYEVPMKKEWKWMSNRIKMLWNCEVGCWVGPEGTLKSPMKVRLGYNFHKDKDYVSLFFINLHSTSSTVFGTGTMFLNGGWMLKWKDYITNALNSSLQVSPQHWLAAKLGVEERVGPNKWMNEHWSRIMRQKKY